jgi:acyl carrier protein
VAEPIDEVRQRIADILNIPVARAAPDAVLTDLVSDSFRLVEMVIELQEDYDVILGQRDIKDVSTVGDLAALLRP